MNMKISIEKGGSIVVMEMNESSACCHCYLLQGYISFQVLLEPDDQPIRVFLLGIFGFLFSFRFYFVYVSS